MKVPPPPAPSRLRRALLLAWALGLLGLCIAVGVRALAPLAEWDTLLRDQPGQLSVFNARREGGTYGLPVHMADFDGDGNMDLAISPMAAASGPQGERSKAGEVYVYRGRKAIQGAIDRKAMEDRPLGLTVLGARSDDFLGTEIYAADVNGDGFQDLLASAQNYDGPDGSRDNCGGVFVVLGRPGLLGTDADGVTIDLAAPPPGVLTITGRRPGDRLGIWVEAGDLDGDGLGDVLMGADQSAGLGAPGTRQHAGMVAVLYGRADLPQSLDLAAIGDSGDPASGVSLIFGPDDEDHFGSCLHARDLDGDGHLELIAAAALNRLSASFGGASQLPQPHSAGGGSKGPNEDRPGCGEVHVIYGDPVPEGGGGQGGNQARSLRLPPALDLADPPPEWKARITLIYGHKQQETAGEELTTGDFNGDGFVDLAVGALAHTSPDGKLQAGAVHVIYWRDDLRGTEIDLRFPERSPPGLVVSHILGFEAQDILGDTLSAGDFNHDGLDDLAVGIPQLAFATRARAGAVAVLYGQEEPFPWRVFPTRPDPPVTISFIFGANAFDLLSYSMEAGDFDGDGYADLFPNAMHGEGAANDILNTGEAYLISGFHLAGGKLEVTAIEPASGDVGTWIPVEVAGAGFTREAETRVLVDGTPAEEVRVLSGSRIACRFPPRGAPGLVAVVVENRYGQSNPAGAFHYLVPGHFLRGDSDGDLALRLNDPLLTLHHLFLGAAAECMDRHDTNDDGRVDIADPVYTLFHLFIGGQPPPPPFPEPGPDPGADGLTCP